MMPMSGTREIKRPVTEEDIRKWEQGWTEMMVTIWQEKIRQLGIIDTMRLHNTLDHQVVDTGGSVTIAHEFMMYGIYVAKGVGRGYRRGNSGLDDENGLQFLGKSYRKAHGLNKKRLRSKKSEGLMTSGKPRQRRDWFTPRYLGSIDILTQVEVSLYGEAYMGTLSNVVGAMFGNVRVSGSRGTVITPTISRF